MHLTSVNTDTLDVHDLGIHLQTISQLQFVDFQHIAFVGQQDTTVYSLYLFNIATGEYHEVIHDLGTTRDWSVSLNAEASIAAITLSPSNPSSNSDLELVSLQENSSQTIDAPGMNNRPVWSPDNSRLAFVQGLLSPGRTLQVITSEGAVSNQLRLPDKTGFQTFLTEWTKCY